MLLRQLISSAQRGANALYGWGENQYGKIGNNSTELTSSPVSVASTVSWSKIQSNIYNTIALKTDGSLWAWGDNQFGQLGQGTAAFFYISTPVNSTFNASWTTVTSGNGWALGLKPDGTLWSWGKNTYGELGNLLRGTDSPVLVSGPAGVSWTAIASGYNYSVGITTTGQLYAWGYNLFGNLGDNTTVNKSTPVLVSGPANTSWISIAAGENHTLAITSTGRLYSWGYNDSGRLGDNSTVDKSTPVLVSGPSNTSWAVISGGSAFSLGITSTGQLYAWGANGGALGNLSTATKLSPVLVSGPAGASWLAIAAGTTYGLGIITTGQLYAWGNNLAGKLGDSSTVTKSSPVLVSGPAATSWITVATSGTTSYAIDLDKRLYAWGYGALGNRGNGDLQNSSSPVLVSGPAATSWTAVSGILGNLGAWGITTANALWAWGQNYQSGWGSGWMGYPTGTSSPQQIGSSSWTAVSLGGNKFMMAISLDGRLYGWGRNVRGQLGILSTLDKSSPVLVSGPTGTSWMSVSTGDEFSLGITTDGKLYSWGYNSPDGQLGDLTTLPKSSPILVSGPANTSWTQISANGNMSLALTSTGQLYAWGYNTEGQLGDLSVTKKSSPVLVSGPTGASWSVVISGGYSSSLALATTGILYAWGANTYGQVGDLSTTNKSSPVLDSGTSGASWIAIGIGLARYASYGITTQGVLYAWGQNYLGNLGDLTTVNKSSPVLVSGPVGKSWALATGGMAITT